MDVLWLGHQFIMTNNKRHTHLQASGVFKSHQGGRRVGSYIWRQEAHASSPRLHREGETKQSPELGLACLLPVESPRKRQEAPGTYQRGPEALLWAGSGAKGRRTELGKGGAQSQVWPPASWDRDLYGPGQGQATWQHGAGAAWEGEP